MSVSVSMPQLGESVTEGTVTRWLKKEGERVEADEPLLEVSTDKVDTEIPSPAAGVLREIAVGEDETVEVGAQLAVIEEGADASGGGAPAESPSTCRRGVVRSGRVVVGRRAAGGAGLRQRRAAAGGRAAAGAGRARARRLRWRHPWLPRDRHQRRRGHGAPGSAPAPAPSWSPPAQQAPAPRSPAARPLPRSRRRRPPASCPASGDGPYVTPLVRKLAAEHGVDLESVSGTGVGGRIRKQDVLDASRSRREQEAAAQAQAAQAQAAPARPRLRPRRLPRRRRPLRRRRLRLEVRRPPRRPARRSCRPRCAAPPSGCPARARSSPSGWWSRCRPRPSSPRWSRPT